MIRTRQTTRPASERVLIEQLLIAHHRAGHLQARAGRATHIEAIKVLNTTAVRLVAEMRRLALAIRQYRSPVASKSFTVVGQQNIASGVEQRVTYVDKAAREPNEASFSARTELIGNDASGDQNEAHLNELREE